MKKEISIIERKRRLKRGIIEMSQTEGLKFFYRNSISLFKANLNEVEEQIKTESSFINNLNKILQTERGLN